ncbi:flagellar motor switch protein FliG [Pelagovum pacificum]|uniref:Flagellar motor switch protein FliG n=2 Tax=Pelagovum pacificum TaxID=2588711 RepID=A0A5C5GHS9_9RHOB|nr:flagellar motor switch protein FliG [Pelagovum pacificum]TNY34322.1 flagellar motor switch protein FliG [Pelagovum pacificum]
MIVQFALSEGQQLPLDRLPQRLQIALARELSHLRLVDRATFEGVADEFTTQLQGTALSAPRSLDEALQLLDGKISAEAIDLLREENARQTGADPWPRVLVLPCDELKPIMESESVEVCAVVLSKLPVSKAAELLGMLPGERARRITYAVSRTHGVSPAAVVRIGEALAETYGRAPAPAFAEKAGRRLGAILNSSQPATRDEVMQSLREQDPDFAEEVRKAIFTFNDLPRRLRKEDVAKVIRLIDSLDLVTAVAAAKADGGEAALAADYLLTNISQRMADQVREEVNDRGRVKKSEAEAAQGRVVSVIRDAADNGEVILVSDDED